MPGTIKVSVLGFMDLPSSSSSSISVTVSMGKKKYQAWEKGDFAFSLTSLRDVLVITVNNVEGNEISRADIQAKSIVEKGFWDDHFPLAGGGQVHVQLQFLLNQDERDKIKTMRQSAMKRKQEEYHSVNTQSFKDMTMARSSNASFNVKSELSVSQKCLLQVREQSDKDGGNLSSPALTSINSESGEKGSRKGKKQTEFDQNQQTLNDADREKDSPSTAPVLPEIDIHRSESSQEKTDQMIDSHSLDDNFPSPSVSLEENTNLLKSSELIGRSEAESSHSPYVLPEVNFQSSNEQLAQKTVSGPVVEVPLQTISSKENIQPSELTVAYEEIAEASISPNADEGRVHKAENRTPMEKTPITVMKMNPAIEGSQAQDMRLQIELPSMDIHSNVAIEQTYLKEDQTMKTKKEKSKPSSSASDTEALVFEDAIHDEGIVHKAENRTPMEKTPITVMQMNPAIEGSQAQDMRLQIELPSMVIHSTVANEQTYLKEDQSMKTKEEKSKPSSSASDTEALVFEDAIHDEGIVHKAENRTPMKKTPITVMKMNPAIEGSQAQDMRLQIELPSMDIHSNVANEQTYLKEDQSMKTKKEKSKPSSSASDMEALVFEDAIHDEEEIKEKDQKINLLEYWKRIELLGDGLLQKSKATALGEKIEDSMDRPIEAYAREKPQDEEAESRPAEVFIKGQSKEVKEDMKKNVEKVNVLESSGESKEVKEDMKKNVEKANVLESSERTKLSKERLLQKSKATALEEKIEYSIDQPKEYAMDKAREEKAENRNTEAHMKDQSKEVYMKKETESQKFIETSTMEVEAATVSEMVAADQLGKTQLANLVDNPVETDKTRKTPSKNLLEISEPGVLEEEQHSSERSNMWIFPDDATKICVTSGGKTLADLMGGTSGSSFHQGEMRNSMKEHRGGSGWGVFKGKETHPENRKSSPLVSKGAETSEGRLRQTLKIAIMVGFGTLVLFTRQRKKEESVGHKIYPSSTERRGAVHGHQN